MPKERVIELDDHKDILSIIAGNIAVVSGAAFDTTISILNDAGLSTSSKVSTVLANASKTPSLVVSTMSNNDLASTNTSTRL